MTPATISVLTRGLSCGHSRGCQGGTLLTAPGFSLWCFDMKIPNATGGGGYATPNNVGNHQGLTATPAQVSYPASTPDLVHIDPRHVMGKRVPVILKFKMGEREIENVYMVSIDKADVIIRMMNSVNSYKKKMSVAVSKITRRTGGIKAIYKRGRAFISKRHDFD